MKRNIILLIIAALLIAVSANVSRAGDDDLWTTVITPDALIVLDLSGSMNSVPNATLYACGTSCNSYSGPYYVDPQPSPVPQTLRVVGSNCSDNGPYTITAPGLMPTSNLWIRSSYNCTDDGPFYSAKPSDSFDLTKVYIGTSSSCTSTSGSLAWYPTSGTGHTKECTVSTSGLSGNTVYKTNASNCATGPFYRSSGTGHTTSCLKYKTCSPPASGFTASDCSTGPFYRSSGSGHNDECGASITCTRPSTVYTETDCTTGAFYNSSGSGHTTVCQDCSKACSPGSSTAWSETTTCDGPFYNSSGTGHTTDCSKLAIAKRALFQLMDAALPSNSITSADVTALGMRLGLMRYYDCNDDGSDSANLQYTNSSSCIKLSWGITLSDFTTTTPYSSLYCNNATSCASTIPSSCSTTSNNIAGFCGQNYTPLGYSLREGKRYLDYHKGYDPSATCRQKSIIVVTDGEDTVACSANGGTGVSQRRAPVYYAKLAADANYKVYVVGFGAEMSNDLKNTLNWMAYFGGTRNPNTTQSGSTAQVSVGTNPCSNGTDPGPYNLSGYAFMASNPTELVSSLQAAITSIQEATYSFSSQASVAAARVQEENYIYEASFEPKNSVGINKEPFWTGHLKKYQIGDDGALITPHCWDAGVILQGTDPDDRNVYTYKSAITAFNTSNITAADLGITGSPTQTVASVVGFYRGEATYNLENWKLGDLYHTNPMIVKTPNPFFSDPRECGSTSYSAFRSANIRTAATGTQVILIGANDGQLHAFHTGNGSDCTSGGDEIWSFIPPNFLQKISPVAHNIHSADIAERALLASHDLTVDGPVQVFDAWVPSADSSGTSKNASDWKSIAIFSEGQGSGAFLWSPSSTCYSTSAFSATYSTTTPYYCGLHALNVTNVSATSPTYMWHLNGAGTSGAMTSAQGPYLGEAWSKAQVGRVKIAGNEKWVAFIGGGYNGSSCLSADGLTSTACNTPATGSAGKGFFVVDLSDGSILWSYTHADNGNMDFSAPATPYPVDLDKDGFIDTVYMGDLGGNMWRFRLCSKDVYCSSCGKSSYTASPCTSCNTSSWSGSRLFSSTNVERGSGLSTPVNTHKQIFNSASATKDPGGNVWVFFGTGEVNDPTSKPTDTSDTKNRLYAIKEDTNWTGNTNFTATYTAANLINITSTIYTDSTSLHGWYKNLSTNPLSRPDGTFVSSPLGEKMISDPTIFGGMIYFATYVPSQVTGSSCGLSGDSFLYKLNYRTGAGAANAATTAAATNADATYIAAGAAATAAAAAAADPGNTVLATAAGGAGTAAKTQALASLAAANAAASAAAAAAAAAPSNTALAAASAAANAAATAAATAATAATAAAADPTNSALAAASATAAANALAAANAATVSQSTQYIGHGEASSVLVSYRPGYTEADIYITASGGAGTAALTQDVGQAPRTSNMTNILYWKDRRLQ